MIPGNKNLLQLAKLTREMLALADAGDRDRDDDNCGVIYGILRDSAYYLRQLAEAECLRHQEKGMWDGDDRLITNGDNDNTSPNQDNS